MAMFQPLTPFTAPGTLSVVVGTPQFATATIHVEGTGAGMTFAAQGVDAHGGGAKLMRRALAWLLLGLLAASPASAQTAQNLHTSATFQPLTPFTAPGTLSVVVGTPQFATATIHVEGTGAGMTFAAQGVTSSGALVTLPMYAASAPSTSPVTSASANGDWVVSVAGYTSFQWALTAISGGTVSVSIATSNQAAVVYAPAGNGGGGGGNVNVSQINGTTTATGNGTTNAGTQRVTLPSDGTGSVTANLGTLNGAATAANQNATAAGTSATSAQGVQGVTNGVPLTTTTLAPTMTTGTLTAGGQTVVYYNPGAYGTLNYDVSGTWSGMIVVEAQATSTGAWTATTVVPFMTAAVNGLGANSAGQALLPYAFRFRAVTWSSGTATITMQSGQGNATVMQDNIPWSVALNTSPSLANGNGFVPTQNGAVLSATNGMFTTGLLSGSVTNPISTLTMTSATTAYTAGWLIANNATAGSIVVPSFAIVNSAGGAAIPRLRLMTNDATSTAWGGQTVQVDLWSAAPTFTNGDRAAWLTATGTASWLGAFSCVISAEQGDGAYSACSPNVGSFDLPKLASGTAIYWTLQAVTGSGVTGAGKVWTLTVEELN